MHHRALKRLVAVSAFAVLFVCNMTAAQASAVPPDDLHTPDHLVETIEKGQKAADDQTLASYRQAMQAHPTDAALALAACTFSRATHAKTAVARPKRDKGSYRHENPRCPSA